MSKSKKVRNKLEAKRKYGIICSATNKSGTVCVQQTANKYGVYTKSLCWDCANAYGKCSWSSAFIPIQGWEATKTEYDGIRYKYSYTVHECPLFEKEEIRKSTLPRLSDVDLPLLDSMQKKRMYCVTDDVYFKTVLECAKYIEEKGGYDYKYNIYWMLTDRRSRGIQTITIGNREYRFLNWVEI